MGAALQGWIDKRWERWLEKRIPRRPQVVFDRHRIFIFPGPRGLVFVGVLLLFIILCTADSWFNF
jgi:hypothetical protein